MKETVDTLDDAIGFVREHDSQSHLCILNTDLFDKSIRNGVYGFPHAGGVGTKSFWRAVSSMFNIGPNDLIFFYRTKGDQLGCQEINGPFKIHCIDGQPCIYYDNDSGTLPMKIDGETDCKVRLLFDSFGDRVFSITKKLELIKKFELKEIWGYRHPAVMNIGAARKKSVTSFTNKQTLLILDLFRSFGKNHTTLPESIPLAKRIQEYTSLRSSGQRFKLNDDFLMSVDTTDEARLYSYIARAIKNPSSIFGKTALTDFSDINNGMLEFSDITVNVMMEVIVSSHLQDELDIVFFDKTDDNSLIMEIKEGIIGQDAVIQTQEYLDLLSTIFPRKNFFANIIGSDMESGVKIDSRLENKIRLVKYVEQSDNVFRFEKM